jgi:hypothetical protein
MSRNKFLWAPGGALALMCLFVTAGTAGAADVTHGAAVSKGCGAKVIYDAEVWHYEGGIIGFSFRDEGEEFPAGECLDSLITGKVIEGYFSCYKPHFSDTSQICEKSLAPWNDYRYFRELSNGTFIDEKAIAWG